MKSILVLLLCISDVLAEYKVPILDKTNFSEKTLGKSVFIKFYAPWCAHCKRMGPAWQQLAELWDKREDTLIAEVDCTRKSGKDLCEVYDIASFPTLMYGDPNNLEEYEGRVTLEALTSFAHNNLKLACSPVHLDLCDKEAKEHIEKFMAMPRDELNALIQVEVQKISDAKNEFTKEIAKLQKQYDEVEIKRDETIDAIRKDGDMGLMISVSKAMRESSKTEEEEAVKEEL